MSENDFILDASVTLAWCFADEVSPVGESALAALETGTAHCPAVWPLEVGNALLGAQRRGRVSEAEIVRFLELLWGLAVEVEFSSPSTVFGEVLRLARDQGLSTYDASYLDLAMRYALPLATLDSQLREAARRCGVSLLGPQ